LQLSANGQISAHYDFRHSLYREVLYRRLSEITRSKLHLLLAQRLKAFCDPCEQELATELALHFEGGRDYEQAVNYLLLAADNAVGRFAYRDCIEILQHAHDLVLKLPLTVRAEIEVRILVSIGHAHFALGALVDSAPDVCSRGGTRPASWSQGGSDARVNLRDVSAGLYSSRRRCRGIG